MNDHLRNRLRGACAHPARTAAVTAAAFGLIGQLLLETVRQNSFITPLGWLVSHLPGFLVGAAALALLLGLVAALVRRPSVAMLIVGLPLFAGGYASFYKQAYRGDPLLPADILLAKDAAGIMEGLSIWPTAPLVVFLLVLALAVWLLWPVRLLPWRGLASLGRVAALAGCLAAWLCGVMWYGPIPQALGFERVPGEPGSLYDKAGFTTGFLSYLGHTTAQKPAGYSRQAVQQALAQLPEAAQPQSTPDIVVVMMESYYHLDNYPGLVTDTDLTANWKRLAAEGVSGYYYSDKYSGGTADMEFGALTGFSTSFLPEGVVPYSQYVATKEEGFPSYPAYLKQLGYRTVAIHPFDGSIYHRNTAYPNLGIDTFIDRDTMTYTETAGKYIGDHAAAQELIYQYEQASQNGNPVFLHMVTMQNHIPNLPEEYPEDQQVHASLPGITGYYAGSLVSVATGLRDADRMVGEITDYFKTLDREVIVLFFGDHQTAIGQQAGEELLDVTGRLEGLSAEEKRIATHRVPYLMWSNQGSENAGGTAGGFPPYLLLPNLLAEYDAPTTPWFQWLYDSQQVLKGTTGGLILQPEGGYSHTASTEQNAVLKMQKILQYAMMFE